MRVFTLYFLFAEICMYKMLLDNHYVNTRVFCILKLFKKVCIYMYYKMDKLNVPMNNSLFFSH